MKDEIRQVLIKKRLVVPNAKPAKSVICVKCNKAYEVLADRTAAQCGNCEHRNLVGKK